MELFLQHERKGKQWRFLKELDLNRHFHPPWPPQHFADTIAWRFAQISTYCENTMCEFHFLQRKEGTYLHLISLNKKQLNVRQDFVFVWIESLGFIITSVVRQRKLKL